MPTSSLPTRPARAPRPRSTTRMALLALALLALPLSAAASAGLASPHGPGRGLGHGHARALAAHGRDQRMVGPERRQLLSAVVGAVTATATSATVTRATPTATTARTVAITTATDDSPDTATDTSTDTATDDPTTGTTAAGGGAGAGTSAVVSPSAGASSSARATGTITVVVNATGTGAATSLVPANTSTLIVIPSSTSTTSATSSTPTLVTSVDHGTTLVKTVTSLAPNSNSTLDGSASTSAKPGGLGTGAIAAIAVVGGLVVLALAGFVVWKARRRSRFGGGDYDDEDGIKWPELNRHGDSSTLHPLPARPTGGHGLETSALDRSETDLDGEPIGAHDADFDYAYPPHAASLRHDDPLGMGSGYYDNSPPLGNAYDDAASGGASYLTLNRAGNGIASSEGHGPFDDPVHDAREYEGSVSHQSLGGTQAFEANHGDNEMRMLGGPASMPSVGRSKSGRLM